MRRGTIALLVTLLAVSVGVSGPAAVAEPPGAGAVTAKKKCKKKGKKGAAAAKKKCKKKKQTPAVSLPPASITLAPSPYFGFNHQTMFSSDDEVFTVTNAPGTGATGPIGTAISGPQASKFTISENTCAGLALPGGQSCTLKVTFAPGGSLGNFSATLTVSATPGGSATTMLQGASSP